MARPASRYRGHHALGPNGLLARADLRGPAALSLAGRGFGRPVSDAALSRPAVAPALASRFRDVVRRVGGASKLEAGTHGPAWRAPRRHRPLPPRAGHLGRPP